MQVFIVLAALIAVTLAGYASDNYYQSGQASDNYQHKEQIPILKSESQLNHDGSYQFGYETGHGIQVQEQGYVKNAGQKDHEVQVAHGSYSYTGPDGVPVSLQYIADENGFQASGSHLPTPPPLPKEIQEALAKLPQHYEEDSHQQYQQQQQQQQSHYKKY